MTTTPRVLLIDLENYPSQVHTLMDDLAQYTQVVICYAQSGAKVPIDWLMRLTTAINDNRLTLFKVPSVGKNAADFGITFWEGKLMAELPPETHFDIVSNDTDLDYVVNLLLDQQRSAERIGLKKENLPTSTDTKITNSTTLNYYLQEYCAYLQKHSNRPAKKETLLNSINAKFKVEGVDANKLLEQLAKQGVIDTSNGKITYNLEKLKQFANS
jgi:hypothetical protein